jgi:hypothetical protein
MNPTEEMEHHAVNKKPVAYWALSLTLLLLCLLLPSPSTTNHPSQPALDLKSHLDVEPMFVFYRDNRFHVRILESLRIDIKPDRLPAHLATYNVLEIDEFEPVLDADYSLRWQVNGHPHQVTINKTRHSLTPFDFQTDDASAITDLHLLLEASHELGNHPRLEQMVSFQNLQLSQASIHNQWAINLSEWLDLTPIKFNTINGYTSSQDLHLKGLIMRLGLWLVLSAILLTIWRLNSVHLVFTLLVAWVLPAGVYFTNLARQHQQVTQAFSEDPISLNELDHATRQLAMDIKQQLSAVSQAKDHSKPKLILVGPKDFFHLRLMRHLFDQNIGLDSGFQRMVAQTDENHFFVLTHQAMRFCDDPEAHAWLKDQVIVLFHNQAFCLMRKT